jgi:hypothetical protein
MSTGAWHPDPSGRHQYRWWDGEHWTTTVSDDGVTFDESPHPIEPPPAPVAGSAAATSLPPPDVSSRVGAAASLSPSAPSEPAPPKSGNQRTLVIVLAVVLGLLAAGALGYFALRDDDGGGGGGGSSAGSEETTGDLTEDGAYLSIDVTLQQGQAFRFRVEPGPDLDSELFLAVDAGTALDIATEIFPAYQAVEEDLMSNPQELADLLFESGTEAFRPGPVQDTFADSSVISMNDPGFEGEPDADFFVALASGTYTVVAQSYGGDGPARLIVEVWDDTVDVAQLVALMETDADAFFDAIPWFQDPVFFEDETPYQP